jgi:protein ImuB
MNALPSPSRSPPPLRRYLAIALPFLPTDRIGRQAKGRSWRIAEPRDDAPLAIIARVKNALRLVALDELAARAGLVRGMPLADARAMFPVLEIADDDPAADAALLGGIADWAERYTPLVATLADGLMLDITGCAHLFGGEAALLADLVARLEGQGFAARAAIADTPGAASAASWFGDAGVVPPGGMAAILAPLPLAALRLDGETIAAMDRVGLKRIGQILGAPRGPLAARFGLPLLRRLDQALGIDEEAIDPRRPAPAFIAERRFAEPVSREDDISATIASLAASLAASLEAHGEGARRIELSLFRVDGAVARVGVGTSRPVRAPKLILDLFREKFAGLGDELDAGFGYDMIRLAVPVTAAADPLQVDLAGEAFAEADLGQLIDRIGARLGPDSIGRIVPRDSHIPERAFAIAEDGGRIEKPAPPPTAGAHASSDPVDRPLRLFARPEPVEATAAVPDGPPLHFRWRRALYRVARAEGPERIASEWWQGETLTRDYFRIEDDAGHRFWLFRDGLYGRETLAPRWYMHGVFA